MQDERDLTIPDGDTNPKFENMRKMCHNVANIDLRPVWRYPLGFQYYLGEISSKITPSVYLMYPLLNLDG